ncbi:MAG: zinc ribbon domain-containing protein [Theionarchaea archaeon]|nr:zinc ribbon domain-containing protein [Theionarchaea archaeon]
MDPSEYRKHIHMLGIGNLKTMKIRTKSDAETVLTRVREMHQGLQQIKKEVELDIRFQGEQDKPKKKSGRFSLFGKKDSPEEPSVSKSNQHVYEKLIQDIGTLMSQLDRLQEQLNTYIREASTSKEPVLSEQIPSKEKQELQEESSNDSLFDSYDFNGEDIGGISSEEDTEELKARFCPHCGNILEASDTFCSTCGKKV